VAKCTLAKTAVSVKLRAWIRECIVWLELGVRVSDWCYIASYLFYIYTYSSEKSNIATKQIRKTRKIANRQ